MRFAGLILQLRAHEGLVQLESELQAYEGSVEVAGELDGRGDTAEIGLNSALNAFQLAPFLKDMELDENLQISGDLNDAASGTSCGDNMYLLNDSLLTEAAFYVSK